MFSPVFAYCQTTTGTLKVFSEEPVIVYVDQVHQPDYSSIQLQQGTHLVKALNKDQVVIYNEIVTIVKDQVTSVLIKGGNPQPQEKKEEKPKVVSYNPNPVPEPAQEAKQKPAEEPAAVAPAINIGQVNRKLPADKSGAFGLTFGMSESDVDRVIQPQMYSAGQKGKGFVNYTLVDQSGIAPAPFLLECRFIDGKLFQILVGYLTLEKDELKNEFKINKNAVPMPEYNKIYAELVSQYGEPTSSERTFKGDSSDGDGKLTAALRKRQALILSSWKNADSGNEAFLTLAYTSAPFVMVVYQDGQLSQEAQKTKLVVHGYKYENSYRDNYFNK